MKTPLLLLLSFVLFAISCRQETKEGQDNVVITGKLENGAKVQLLMEELTTSNIVLTDSVTLDDEGTFILQKAVKEPAFYRLRINDRDFITLILDTSPNIHITGNAQNLAGTYSIAGSPSSELLREFNMTIRKSLNKVDSLSMAFEAARNSGKMNMDSLAVKVEGIYKSLIYQREEYVKSFIKKHPGSIVNLAAINYLNPENDFWYFRYIDSTLSKSLAQSSYLSDFHKRVESLKKLAIGSPAPDILLSNPEGEQVALSTLKGNVTLIDFWASWCGPCRKANPELVRIYNKYKSKGFRIYGVSLDKNKEDWLKAIEADKLTWVQVSDLKFWESAAAKLYNTQSIPYTYLIDKNGIIVAKGIHGKELDDKLFNMLK